MKDSILQRYTGRNSDDGADGGTTTEHETVDDLGAFGWLRGVRDRAVTLELRKKTGTVRGIPYGWIEVYDFEPSGAIVLVAGGQKIRITGRNLNREIRPNVRLFEGLCRQKIPWLQEADHVALMKAEGNITVIEKLEW